MHLPESQRHPHLNISAVNAVRIEHMTAVLKALPDPTFILSQSGKYLGVFGGNDSRYYHDGSALVGLHLSNLISAEKAQWFLDKITQALQSNKLLIEEYELSDKDVLGVSVDGPDLPIWFEGRIQPLDFTIAGERVVLWVASNISKRHEMERQLREYSDTDQLTGLFNRRRLEQDVSQHYEQWARYSRPCSILMLDLDNLKAINDTLGHHMGDNIIVAMAETCREQCRQADSVYRFGGDEFVLALPCMTAEQALAFAERLRQSTLARFELLAISGLSASVSIGVACMATNDSGYQDSLKRADAALYRAKRAGKNCVVFML
ncbi:GGDEF domain-containing protein [Shewanella algidipiscicola]|uniref:sensor domain-containing diguanylate cyclase n=1 Tax=Shewanella algidipiscicola TaxID=614070 RepID=UPI000D78792B|nr:GGDEF domain-containing protein [Shewanella algidipiscicola]